MHNSPFVPDHIKEPRTFYDRRRGLMLLGKWNDELWLFRHNVEQDCWTSVRKATDEDVQTVEAAILNSNYPS